MEYNEAMLLPQYGSKSMDLWGYFNNKSNTSLVPRQQIYYYPNGNDQSIPQIITIGGIQGGRDVNETAIQTGVLNKIIYPTKGFTKFEYEVNKYKQFGINYLGGGLRVKSIKSYNHDSKYIIGKKYQYGLTLGDTSGVGYVNSTSLIRSKPLKKKVNFFAWPVGALSSILSFDWDVTNYGGGLTSDENDFDNVNVYYPFVTEYQIDSLNNYLGKTEILHSYHADNLITSFMAIRPVVESYHYKRGKPIQKLIYNNKNELIYKLTSYYDDINYRKENNIGILVDEKVIISGKSSESDGYNVNVDDLPYAYAHYGISQGSYELIHEQEEIYSPSGIATKDKDIQYNASGYPSIIKESKSDGVDTLIRYYKYAKDYIIGDTPTNIGNSSILSLINSNYLKIPLEESLGVIKGNNTSITSAIFRQISTNLLLESLSQLSNSIPLTDFQFSSLSSQGTIQKDYRYEKLITLNKYNNQKKIEETQRLKEPIKSYVWDRNGINLIAEVIGAKLGDQVSNNSIHTESLNLPLNLGHTSVLNFTVDFSGSVILVLNRGTFLSSNNTTYINYNLIGPSNASGSLCMNNVAGSGCYFTNTAGYQRVLVNIPPGDYQLKVSTNTPVSGSSASINITYPKTFNSVVDKEIFYESFEEGNLGSFSKLAIGSKLYLGDYTVPFIKSNSKRYIIDYKYVQNNKVYSINKEFQNYMILSEGEAIDEVRIYPIDAQMWTYTYDPLIGMTSKTNPDGKTEFYTYDGLQRLKNVLDFEGNILKNYQYNYRP